MSEITLLSSDDKRIVIEQTLLIRSPVFKGMLEDAKGAEVKLSETGSLVEMFASILAGKVIGGERSVQDMKALLVMLDKYDVNILRPLILLSSRNIMYAHERKPDAGRGKYAVDLAYWAAENRDDGLFTFGVQHFHGECLAWVYPKWRVQPSSGTSIDTEKLTGNQAERLGGRYYRALTMAKKKMEDAGIKQSNYLYWRWSAGCLDFEEEITDPTV